MNNLNFKEVLKNAAVGLANLVVWMIKDHQELQSLSGNNS